MMADNIVIRRGQVKDLHWLPDIELEADTLFPPGRLPPEVGTLTDDELSQACEEGHLFVAMAPEQPIGFVCGRYHGERLHLNQVSVLPAFCRRGIGRTLVQTFVEHAQTLGVEAVTLNTFRDIRWNAPFYETLGFREARPEELHPLQVACVQASEALGMTQRVPMILPLT